MFDTLFRQLRRSPTHCAIVIATMAIGIAAASAIFTVVRGVILRPLPYRAPDELVTLQEYQPAMRRDQSGMSYDAFLAFRSRSRALARVSAFSNTEIVLSDGDASERVIGATTDADLFDLLGAHPLAGRSFTAGEDDSAPAHVVILSFRLWQRRYGGDPALLGRSVVLDGEAYTVVGIMPERFEFPRNQSMARDIELWIPRRPVAPPPMRRGMRNLTVIGRLRPNVTPTQAALELTSIATQRAEEDPAANGGWNVRVISLRDFMIGRVRPTLLLLAACVAVLLCIVCVNVAAATLARVSARQQAIVVRIAMGAGYRDVAKLLLGESVALGLIAGIIALPASAAMRAALIRLAPVAVPRQSGIQFDAATLAFALVLAIILGLAAGAAPVLWLRRLDLRDLLSDASRTTAGSPRLRRSLTGYVVAQLILGTMLLGVTAQLYAGYSRLNHVDPGFRADGVLTATIALGGQRYQKAAARTQLSDQLLSRVRAMPGVVHAAIGSLLPLSGGLMADGYGIQGAQPDSSARAALRSVSGDFFETVGIAMRAGRPLTDADDEHARPVVVVNQALVRESLSGRNPIGAMVFVSAPGADSTTAFEIVGVVGDAKEKELAAPASPIIYFSNRQASFPHMVLAVRARGSTTVATLQSALHDIDPSLALDDVGSLQDKVRASYALELFLVIVLGAFAICASALLAVGVYGSTSFLVTSEMREIGIRMALGASPMRVLGSILGRAVATAGAGYLIGIALVAAGGGVLPTMLTQTSAAAYAALGGVVVLLIATAAGAIPALRGSRADPVEILRCSV